MVNPAMPHIHGSRVYFSSCQRLSGSLTFFAMSRRQLADAASRISPFVLAEPTTAASPPPSDLPPPSFSDNTGKQGKTKKARAKDRTDRHPTVDEERRFYTGPPRNPSSRAGRRPNDNRFLGRLGLGYGGKSRRLLP